MMAYEVHTGQVTVWHTSHDGPALSTGPGDYANPAMMKFITLMRPLCNTVTRVLRHRLVVYSLP